MAVWQSDQSLIKNMQPQKTKMGLVTSDERIGIKFSTTMAARGYHLALAADAGAEQQLTANSAAARHQDRGR